MHEAAVRTNLPITVTKFDERVLLLHDRITYKRMSTPQDMEAVHRLRYDAYVRARMIDKDDGGDAAGQRGWSDDYDRDPNCYNMAVYHEDRMLGCIRIHVADRAHQRMPSTKHIPDYISEWLAEGHTLVDCSRFSHVDKLPGYLKLLPFATLRLTCMACVHFDADYSVQVVQKKHAGFYQNQLHSEFLEDRNIGFDNGKPFFASVLRADVRLMRVLAFQERAHLLSLPSEREALFGSKDSGFVKPTARRVIEDGEESGI